MCVLVHFLPSPSTAPPTGHIGCRLRRKKRLDLLIGYNRSNSIPLCSKYLSPLPTVRHSVAMPIRLCSNKTQHNSNCKYFVKKYLRERPSITGGGILFISVEFILLNE